ncbi:MAG TPA: AMP-binding protein [Hyphomicrobiaceae bacterium]|jgi:fatty-acyl-CoA synthase
MSDKTGDISLWIERHAGFNPGRTALRFQGRTLSYADLAVGIERTAAMLHELGLRRGDRIAWLGLNHPDMLRLLFAAARCGLMLVPLNWRLAPPEHAFILRDAGVKALFAQRDLAAALGPETLPESCRLVLADAVSGQVPDLHDLMAAAGEAPGHAGGPDDPLLLVYTSGTTGRPKGAVLTQRALECNAANALHMHDMTARDHILTVLPLFHVGGLNIQTTPALKAGAMVTLHERFDPGAFLAAVAADRPSLAVLVPATISAVLAHPAWDSADLSSLRAVATGSMAVPTSLIAALHARGVPVIQVYGATETAPVAVYQRVKDAYDSVGSMGRVGLNTEVRVVDANGAGVGPGVPGEVLVRGAHVASGYWNDPEATAKAFAGGWFRSGDIAAYDAEGLFWFKDRVKNVIVSGGENIYPAEVERVLCEMPGIRECQVIGRPDERWGMVPVAAVVADAGVSREAVLQHFEGRLARFKHPRDAVFLAELPRNAMGKVRLDELARIVAQGNAG